MNYERLTDRLTLDEGFRSKPYRDTVGKLTIGIGRNLDDVGISKDEARYLLRNDIARAERLLDTHLPWWRNMSEVRQEVLLNMCLNMGIGSVSPARGLLSFRNTLRYMEMGEYSKAASGMMASKWARQVGPRASRLSRAMRTNKPIHLEQV